MCGGFVNVYVCMRVYESGWLYEIILENCIGVNSVLKKM